jgi:hypothetical protein
MEQVQSFLDESNRSLNVFFANPYVNASIITFLILYGALAAPALPPVFAKMFDFTLFKMFILALILIVNYHNPVIGILMAVGFFLSLQCLSRYKANAVAVQVTLMRRDGSQSQSEPKQSAAEEVVVSPPMSVNIQPSMMSSASVPIAATMTVSPPMPTLLAQSSSSEASNVQVSGLAGRADQYMGAQGMDAPYGFSGPVMGADYTNSY